MKDMSRGNPDSLGAVITPEGVNFAIYSKHAQEVYLLLFEEAEGPPSDIIPMKSRTDNVWHILVKGIGAGQMYGYKVCGEYDPDQGKRFNPHKLLIDPYAKALSGKFRNEGNSIFAYDLDAEEKDLRMNTDENFSTAPRSIVVDDSFDWEGDVLPGIPMSDLIIYETHVKGFTAHPSSGVRHPGTYPGLAEKIPYLKDLGVNAIELMPVHEFHVRGELLEKGLNDFWGYNTIAFFAPEISYSTRSERGCQVREFKEMVREFHKAGIEVILDVVYNHTGEGNEFGPTMCFKGIDNPSYYSLAGDTGDPARPYRHYINDSGCGNVLNIESPPVMRLVLDSLRYWAETMHVDGFRFDLATILGKTKGKFSTDSAFFKAVSEDRILKKVKMIAEPWDLTTYQVGNFPVGWSEWNGVYRDTARRFLKGDEARAADMATRITGSADLYQDDGRKPSNSVNFITCHDGFTMRDIYSYNHKHNEANHEDNRDGADDNHSWNCGAEGETDDPGIIRLRKQMIKNAFSALLFSAGTPMILYGDEVMRTQKGNNNTYCQDNELTWFNWEDPIKNSDMLEYVRKAISFRKEYPILRARRFFTGSNEGEGEVPDILWFGKHLDKTNWRSPKVRTLCYQLAGRGGTTSSEGYYLFLVFNMHYRGVKLRLPVHEGFQWYRLIDTARDPGDDFRDKGRGKLLRQQKAHYFRPRSVSVFIDARK